MHLSKIYFKFGHIQLFPVNGHSVTPEIHQERMHIWQTPLHRLKVSDRCENTKNEWYEHIFTSNREEINKIKGKNYTHQLPP